jgi:hypothetical protein
LNINRTVWPVKLETRVTGYTAKWIHMHASDSSSTLYLQKVSQNINTMTAQPLLDETQSLSAIDKFVKFYVQVKLDELGEE